VHGLLRARHAYAGLYDELAYWAPAEGGTEVDFLVRRGRAFIAIEVKATARPERSHLRGLAAVAALPGLERRILVHLGSRPFRTADGIEALPATVFAEALAAGKV